MTFAVIIIAAIVSVILIKTALSTITTIDNNQNILKAEKTNYFADSCLQETLIQLKRDNAYAGGTLNILGGSCAVTIAGTDNTREISIEGNQSEYYRNITAQITLDPFQIVKWDY